MVEDKKHLYEEMKDNILECIGNINAKKIKNNFKMVISSGRALENINTVNDLFNVLEERDTINEDNLLALEKIFNYLLKNEEIDNINELKSHVMFYKKQYPTNDKCKICEMDIDFENEQTEILDIKQTEIADKSVATPTAPPIDNINLTAIPTSTFSYEQDNSKIDQVISVVSKDIGKNWRNLATLLDVKQLAIANIKKKHSNDEHAAMEALKEWKLQNKRQPVEDLIRSLVEALRCKELLHHCYLANEIEEEYLMTRIK